MSTRTTLPGAKLSRTVAWFSCGAASAVAAKLALDENPETVLARCIIGNEHPDNWRFARDVERWLGVKAIDLASTKYPDAWAVWEQRRFLNGPKGALCTTELKKMVRFAFQLEDDVQVFGFTKDEQERADRFMAHNFEIDARFPLIEQGLTKADCFEIIKAQGIQLPAMYRMGYYNANCVGCVKGGKGYWNKIRRDFPEVFERMAKLEREIGHSCIHDESGMVFLDELNPRAGRHKDLIIPDCGFFCGQNESSQAIA